MTTSNPAREIEMLAFRTVDAWVGDRGVVRFTGDGHDVDFRIDYRDGRTAIGEVGWHADPAVEEMWANIHKQAEPGQIPLPTGSGIWIVSSWGTTHIKRLYNELPSLVSEMIAQGVDSIAITGSWPSGPLADKLRQLDLVRIVCHDKHGPDVAVLFASGGGFEIPDANGIVDWFEQVLADPDYADTSAKLLRLDADERHVFLMTGSRTEYGVDERLRQARDNLPTRTPILPAGITHLWGVPRFGADPRAVVWAGEGWKTVAVP